MLVPFRDDFHKPNASQGHYEQAHLLVPTIQRPPSVSEPSPSTPRGVIQESPGIPLTQTDRCHSRDVTQLPDSRTATAAGSKQEPVYNESVKYYVLESQQQGDYANRTLVT